MPSDLNNNDLIEAGACPNCWGTQEYADQFVQYQKDRDRNVVNMDKTAKKAFIQTFVQDNMTGIQLKKEGYLLVCQKCKKGYNKA
ncbi:MAG: hypothetical protein AB8G77_11940 [Rhodothermales bacterium]